MSDDGVAGRVRLSCEVSPRNVTGRSRDNARVLRHHQTPAEKLLWDELRGRKLDDLKFRRQVPIGRFIVDFLCFDAGLVIEVDGAQHFDRYVHEYDDARTIYLNEQGLKVLRFTNNEIETNLPAVLEHIRAAIKLRTTSSGARKE